MRGKIDFIIETLNDLFPNPEPPLNHSNPYTLLIAVLLSAQCTDERVNIVTKTLFSLADSPEKMILLETSLIEETIKSLGLHKTKAKAIKNLSLILVNDFEGEVPNCINSLESLPGVGHKTASVIMISSFNTPAFPVDTHIHRLAKRWGLSSGKNVLQTEKDLKKIFEKKHWSDLHLQMIYYGRAFCPAKKHDDEKCLICKKCNGTNVCI